MRFWVPGCASGEEAYSLAMAWAEFRGANHLDKTSFQIFASDINQQVIDKARSAIYPESIASDVSPERLARFFSPIDAGYQIVKDIRETCVFARHDLTRDPPFSKLGPHKSEERPHIPGSAPAAQGDACVALRASSWGLSHARRIRVGGRVHRSVLSG